MREAYSERVTQVTRVMDAVARSPHPVVLCGDFNDVPVSWALQAARGGPDTHDLRDSNGWDLARCGALRAH